MINFPGACDLQACALLRQPALRRRFSSAWMLQHPRYDNAVGVFLDDALSARGFRQRLERLPAGHPARGLARTPVHLRRLA